MKTRYLSSILAACLGGVLGMSSAPAWAATNYDFDVVVDGIDPIFLAGRVDVLPIPAPPAPFVLARHGGKVPEYPLVETLPPSIPVVARATVSLAVRTAGGVSYFNGFDGPITGPDGNKGTVSVISGLGGISGYRGPEGALVGVFLSDANPRTLARPATLNPGANFTALSPGLRQVFFIGDGYTDTGVRQIFRVPAGATRLVLGIADGSSFQGVPGYYEDNNGGFTARIRLTVP